MTTNTDPPTTSIAAQEQRQVEWAHLPRKTRLWKKLKVLTVVGVWALLAAFLGVLAYDATGINIMIFFVLWAVSILLVGRTHAHRIGVPYSIF